MKSTLLEIGPGRGDFLFWLAGENPLSQVFAIEYKKKRFDKLVCRLEKNGLKNISLHRGDARLVLPQEFSDESLDQVFILFSDPWPKRRHAKHRLFQASFIHELARVLKPEGKVFIAHDDPQYVTQIRQVFRSFARLFLLSGEGIDFPTFYAEKWKKEGRHIRSFSYQKLDGHSERDDLTLPCCLV